MTAKTARNYLQTQLQEHLYNDLYTRGELQPLLWRDEVSAGGESELVHQLSVSNSGRGCLEAGWEVVGAWAGEIAVKRHRLTLWVTPDALKAETRDFHVGSKARLRMPKELRAISPGYYFALSDKADADEDSQPQLRLYWNLKPEGAPLLMKQTTERLNAAQCYFHLKVLNNPTSYSRCDAGVLYFKRTDYPVIRDILALIYQTVAQHLKPRTPAFTKALAPGLGLAEDPGQVESFGQHRCRLLADGIIRAEEQGAGSIENRLKTVSERFAEDGIDIRQPFLCPGSNDCYDFPLRNA
jgi:hypothetical protein